MPSSSFPAGRQQLALTLALTAAAVSRAHVSAAMRRLCGPPQLDNLCATASGRPTTLQMQRKALATLHGSVRPPGKAKHTDGPAVG